MVARLLPYPDPASGAPEAAIDDPPNGYGVPYLAAGVRGTLIGWQPDGLDSPPVARLAGAGPDPGATVFDVAPTGVLGTRSAELRFHSTRADASFQCRVDEGGWEPCASPHTLTGLTDRVHSATVRSVGPEGWVERAPAAETRWRTEAAPPDTRITEPPMPAEKQPGVTFAADEAALFDCRVDRGEWVPCSPYPWVVPELSDGYSLRGLPDGPHVFEARAIDESGRVEVEPARWEFTLDRRAPETRIQSGPLTTAEWEQPTFQFSSDEPGVRYECKRAEGSSDEWSACRSGEPVSGLFRRVHVRAIDPVGNIDGSPAEWGNASYEPGPSVAVSGETGRAVFRGSTPPTRRCSNAASTASRSGVARRSSWRGTCRPASTGCDCAPSASTERSARTSPTPCP